MYPTAIKTIAAAALLLAAATASAQTILYVDADGTAAGGGNGSSWAQAYNNAHPLGLGSGLEAALRHTRDNPGAYELWVAEGTYLPTRQIGPPVRSKTFQIGPNVHLYGGFAGNETSRGQRAPQVHRTVLSGDIGVANVHTDNSMHVVTFNLNNNELATLDGFEVRLGRSETFTGAGMIVSRGSPAFVDCRFVDNLAVYGGAVYIYNVNSAALTRPTFTRCTFSANQATGTQTGGPFPNNLGGAVCVHATNATLGLRVEFTECSFDGNTAQYGGGIGNSGGILLVDRCRFVGNTGVVAGAGINNRPGEVTIIGGAFLGGTGGHGAGVTTLTGLSPGPLSLVCYDTLFLGNQVTGDGGAILAHVSNFKLVNCLLEKNSAVTGGAISISGNGVNELLGCTTHGNQASSQGGGIFYNQAAGGTLTAANSIFWGNTALIGTTEGRQFHTGGVVSGVSVTNSCIQGLATNFGTGNIGNDAAAHDPRFLDPDGADNVAGNEDDDLRIPINSPCANSGNNSRIPPDALDFDRDGNTSEGVPFDLKRDPRINTAVSPTVDMGAYEYHPDQDNDFVSDLRDNCVATANRDQADADADGFGNACDPTIESLSPGAGAAGMTVTVNGSGFILWNANPPQVFFGASPSPSVTYQSPGVLQARVPAGTGVVDVRVRNGNGAEAIRTAFFTYTDLSVVVGQKVPVPAAGYTPVRLSGPVWKDPAGDAFALFAVDDRKAIEIRWTNGADTFVAQYAVSYPASFAPEHVIDITSGLGGAIPAGATDLEVFNEKEWNPGSGFPAEPLNENDELGVIFYAQGSSTLRVFALRVLEASPQYVLLKHRSGGQLRFQVYRVLPGGAFSSSRQLAAARKVGDRLEPFYPLNELIARTSPALVTPDDTKFQTINWARYWLNPEQTTQVFAVNAHPDADPAAGAPVHSFLTIEWPRILTKRDAFSNWVPDPQPQAGSFPYLHRFELYWEKDLSSTQERTITLSAGQGAPLPAGWNYHWQFDAVRGRWTVSDVEVFDQALSVASPGGLAAGTRGNANDEMALVYLGSQGNRLAPARGDWRVFSLQPPAGAWNPSSVRRGGEGQVLLKFTAAGGAIEFATYRVMGGAIDLANVVVGSRLLPFYPLDELLFDRDHTRLATVDIEPDVGSTGWWIHHDSGRGSHIYAVNRGTAGQLVSDPHVTVSWLIPEHTLKLQDAQVRQGYTQRFDIVWPHQVPGAVADVDYRVLRIQGLEYDGHGFIPVRPDETGAGFPKVYYEPRVFEGIGSNDITGGYGAGSVRPTDIKKAGAVNPNDEHALFLGGHLYAGRDDSTLTTPYVLLGHRATPTGPLAFEAFKVERDIQGKRLFAGQLVQIPVPYLFLEPDQPAMGRCPGTRFVNGAGAPIGFGWKDANANVWLERRWPPPESPSLEAYLDYHEWWFPGVQAAGNTCRDWIQDLHLTVDWPEVEGIGPGQYIRLSVGEALDRSGNEKVQILYNTPRGAVTDAANVALVHGLSGNFTTLTAESSAASGQPVLHQKFVSAIGASVKAGPCAGDRWASFAMLNGSNPQSAAVEVYKVECPPVQGRLVPTGPSCFFSERVGLYFWPLRKNPEEYATDPTAEVFTSGGLYNEANLPTGLIDALYAGSPVRFQWQYMSAADFQNGLANWQAVENTSNKFIVEGPGIATLQDRYYRARYYGHPACSCPPPPTAAEEVAVRVATLGSLVDIQALEVNQRQGGGEWFHLGSYAISGPNARVEVRVQGPMAYADAVRFVATAVDGVPIPEADQESVIADDAQNADPRVSTASSGSWSTVAAPAQHGASARYTTSSTATFTFRFQPPSDARVKEFDVYARWPAGAGGIEIHQATGTWYSPWTEPMFVPGWLKRVLQGADLENFKLDTFHEDGDTYINLPSIIGKRAEDTIAMNCDPRNLESMGLLELYTNVLLRARSFSVDYGIENPDANQQLLLAASRIAQMHLFLGHEAYADALDPTIGTAFSEGNDLEPEKYHAFRNQMNTLLDEELALLRGRARERNHVVFIAPLYNRLAWNFTDDIAKAVYTACYYPTSGIITAADAQRQFPQGHGDAYGHYLSALRDYYDLLASPFFAWANGEEHVLVNGTAVLVNFLHARRLAQAGAAFARAGRDVVALEFRKQYRADPSAQLRSYLDEDTDDELLPAGDSFGKESEARRAWSVHDWATRAATGAYLNWAAVASRLPAESQEVGLKKVDRRTVLELDEITTQLLDITKQFDLVDSGLNPLGMAREVVPFDIDIGALQACKTHCEQTFEKAVNAIGNAVAILNFANLSKNRLRQQQDEFNVFERTIEDQEQGFKSRLIEVFGRPYAEDPDALDLDGPDLLHFAYVDVGELTGRESDYAAVESIEIPWKELLVDKEAALAGTVGNANIPGLERLVDRGRVEVHYSGETGLLVAPPNWSQRPEEGRIQQTLRQLHVARGRLEQSILALETLVADVASQLQFLSDTEDLAVERIEIVNTRTSERRKLKDNLRNLEKGIRLGRQMVNSLIKIAANTTEGIPKSFIAGLATGGDLTSPVRMALLVAAEAGRFARELAETALEDEQLDIQDEIERQSDLEQLELAGIGDRLQQLQLVHDLQARVRSLPGAALQLNLAREELNATVALYPRVLGEGLRLLEERERFRRHTVRALRQYRHNDLTFRLFHNDALQKYRAAFDLAAIYSYLAVQTFDYETNLLGTNHRIGKFGTIDQALEAVLQARSPGAIIGQTPSGGSGLTGVLADLNTEFIALKADIRFCNTQPETRRFSLREMLLQLPLFGAQNDDAWRTMLLASRVDLHTQEDVKRLAQIQETLAADEGEPAWGLVLRFPSGIVADRNFFLERSLGGGQQFNPEHLTTKVLRAGVFFENYPAGVGRLSETPFVYLIPAGASVLRSPVATLPGVPKPLRFFQLVDQLMPRVLPDFLDQASGRWRVDDQDGVATDPDWRPPFDRLGLVRKINPFVAGNARNLQAQLPYTGLVGRTVWNTEWILVIPGRVLGAPGNNPELGIQLFIDNVTDIVLRFETYSYENPF